MDSDRTDAPAPGDRLTREQMHSLVERHLPVLRTYVRLKLGAVVRTKEAVSDVVQSAARELVETLDGFEWRGEDAFRGYVYRVAARKILEKKRRYTQQVRDFGREEELDPEDFYELPEIEGDSTPRSPQRIAIRREELARLQGAFAELDERDQQILSMRRVFGLPVREVARELDLGESTVRWRLSEIMMLLTLRLRDTNSD